VRAVVFAYHGIGCVGLEAVLRHGFDVRAVVTHPDDAGEEIWWESVAGRAEAHGLPVIRRAEAGEPGLRERVEALRPEIIFSFYYRHLLPQEILALAPNGAFNLHGSLLPRYRGRAPVNWVLVHGETETGVTLHRMITRADAGAIIERERVEIAPLDTAYTLFRKLEAAAARLLDRALPALAAGTAREIPQDAARATVFGARRPADGRIDWSWPAARVCDLVRAVTHPYPGAFTDLRGRKMFVWWALPQEGRAAARPGSVLAVDRDGVVVAAGEGNVRLVTVQLDGQPELPAAAFALAERLVPEVRFDAREGGA
jgi:UDP-4-amino-4-deoxy-L-arabinose formyltransferase / UDP-glucuronic acid dehydrogenase (UDP-4-keto-hexauronic acid decarboxylating)